MLLGNLNHNADIGSILATSGHMGRGVTIQSNSLPSGFATGVF